MEVNDSKSDGSEALGVWRKKHGLTQHAAGKRLGVSQATWSDWESGKKTPSLKLALRITSMTGVKVKLWGLVHDAA